MFQSPSSQTICAREKSCGASSGGCQISRQYEIPSVENSMPTHIGTMGPNKMLQGDYSQERRVAFSRHPNDLLHGHVYDLLQI